MKFSRTAALIVFLGILFPALALAEGRWTFQVGTGGAYSLPTPLDIDMNTGSDINVSSARYDTRSFSTQAIYYNFKLGYWENNAAWEFESLHHKLYLVNKPKNVQQFHISHGYNMNTVNRAWDTGNFIYRVGGGFIMTHPETKVNGKQWEDKGGVKGFYVSGLSAQAAVEKRWYVTDNVFLSLEGKLTAGYAIVPVAEGSASVPNVALHGIGSVGYRF